MGFGLLQSEELSKLSQRRRGRKESSDVAKFDSRTSGDACHLVSLFAHSGTLGQFHKSRHEKVEEKHVVVAGAESGQKNKNKNRIECASDEFVCCVSIILFILTRRN